MIRDLVVLGARGDLTGRYLLPAIARLQDAGALPQSVTVTGVDRDPGSDDDFRSYAVAKLDEHAADVAEGVRRGLASELRYRCADVADAAALAAVVAELDGAAVFYLALPNTLFALTLRALAEAGLPADSRIVIEKPFGADAADARALNEIISSVLNEDAVFRIDHFLGKQTVLNVLGLRFANRIFEPVWNSVHIERVEIIWEETLSLEGRAGYYDQAGALRDMIQNHLLQLVSLVAMEPPTDFGERALRDRKVDVLRAVRSPSRQEVVDTSRRGRYTAGRTGGREVPDYAAEPGVDPRRRTETAAEVTLFVDNWRWSGVPFLLRSGKAFSAERREIALHFRPVPHLPFEGEAAPDVLRFALTPDVISLAINLNGAGDPFDLEREELVVRLPNRDLPAYSLLILEILDGEAGLSVRGDEAEEAWRIVEPVLAAWKEEAVPLEDYPAGGSMA